MMETLNVHCRTCFSTTTLAHAERHHIDMLEKCSSVQINESAIMICRICKVTLNNFYTFNLKFLEVNKLFDKCDSVDVAIVEKNEPEMEQHKCPICFKKYLNKTSLNSHLYKHRKKHMSAFVCPEKCLEKFPSANYLLEHVQKFHPDLTPQIKCDECGELFVTPELLWHHVGELHPCKTIKCPCCGNTFNGKSIFLHISTFMDQSSSKLTCNEDSWREKPKTFTCAVCFRKYLTQTSLSTHVTKHRKKYRALFRVKCPRMCATFRSIDELSKHIEENHLDLTRQVKCDACDEYFFNDEHLWDHFRTNHLPNTITCHVCGNDVSGKFISLHYFSQHGSSKNTIEDINKKLRVRADVKENDGEKLKRKKLMRKRTNAKICTICGKILANIHAHVHKVHGGGSSKFHCRYCAQPFDTLTMLKRHTLTHSLEERLKQRKFACDNCGKLYLTRTNLNQHVRLTHSDAKFECAICGKSFKARYFLRNHMRMHTDERPFACDVCNMRFRDRSTLITHHRRHTGEKPYECTICGRGFVQSWPMRVHMLTHNATK